MCKRSMKRIRTGRFKKRLTLWAFRVAMLGSDFGWWSDDEDAFEDSMRILTKFVWRETPFGVRTTPRRSRSASASARACSLCAAWTIEGNRCYEMLWCCGEFLNVADFRLFRFSDLPFTVSLPINSGIHVCPALEGDCRLFSSPPTVPWCPGFHKFSCCSFEQKETFIELQVPHSVLKLLFDLRKQKRIQGWECGDIQAPAMETSAFVIWQVLLPGSSRPKPADSFLLLLSVLLSIAFGIRSRQAYLNRFNIRT